MSEVTVTIDNFDGEIMKSDIPVLIDFWASWCGPCMMLAPTIAEIAEEYAGKVKVCKVNVDEQPDLAMSFKVSSIPTLVVMKNGEITNTSIGYQSKQEIIELF